MNQRDSASRETTMVKRKKGKWIQSATEKMEAKGTEGKFGKATPKKIDAAKKKGGVEEKRAVFAENMKKIAAKRKHGTALKGSGSSGRTGKYTHSKKRRKGTDKR